MQASHSLHLPYNTYEGVTHRPHQLHTCHPANTSHTQPALKHTCHKVINTKLTEFFIKCCKKESKSNKKYITGKYKRIKITINVTKNCSIGRVHTEKIITEQLRGELLIKANKHKRSAEADVEIRVDS